MSLLVVLVLELIVLNIGSCDFVCKEFPGEEFCYELSGKTAAEAEELCKTQSTETWSCSLIMLDNEEKTDRVLTFLNEADKAKNTFWIGLTRVEKDKNLWDWPQRKYSYIYTNWKNDEPNNNGDERCVQADGSKGLKWQDISCDSLAYVICEFYEKTATALIK